MTKRKIQNILRKAGHFKSEYRRSGQIRGWGEWSEGYKVEEGEGWFRVTHTLDRWASRRDPEGSKREQRERVQAYHQTLEKAGVSSILADGEVPQVEIHF